MRTVLSRLSAALLIALPLSVAADATRTGAPDFGDADAGIVYLLPSVSVALAASDDVSIDSIDKVKRGKQDVKLRAEVGRTGLVCIFKIKYADGNVDTIGDVESKKSGVCETEFDVPDRKGAVGDATVKLKVETKRGEDRGKASRNFAVSDRRGG